MSLLCVLVMGHYVVYWYYRISKANRNWLQGSGQRSLFIIHYSMNVIIQVSSNNTYNSGHLDVLFLMATVSHLIRDALSGQMIFFKFSGPWRRWIVMWQESFRDFLDCCIIIIIIIIHYYNNCSSLLFWTSLIWIDIMCLFHPVITFINV